MKMSIIKKKSREWENEPSSLSFSNYQHLVLLRSWGEGAPLTPIIFKPIPF